MANTENDGSSQSQEGALAALLEVSQEPDVVGDYRTIASAFEDEDYRTIINLAWRHQFNPDRLNYKREIRELQQFISQRVLNSLGTGE